MGTARRIKLKPMEMIYAVVPEEVVGPGWANRVTWVYIYDSCNNEYRFDCLQQDEATETLCHLHSIGARTASELIRSIPIDRE